MRRALLGFLAGIAAAGAVLVVAAAGRLEGPHAVVLVLLALLAVPVSRELPRRVLLTGAIIVGWWPVTWWVGWSGGIGRTAIGLAVLVGGLAAWVACGADRRARAARLLPRFRAADLVLAGAGVIAVALRWPWLTVRTPESALSALLGGWDHSAHFNITAMQLRHGGVVGLAPAAPHGDTWSYTEYPQGGHSLIASLMELLSGPTGVGFDAVVTYVRAVGLLDVLLVVLVASAVCSLPALRRRPWAAAPAAALVVGALVLGPGGGVLTDGFPTYVVVLALLAVLPFLVIPAPRVVDPVRLAAVGGVLVGLAHGWTLVLVLAAPAVLVLLLPLERRRWQARPAAWAASVAVVLATAAAGLWALAMVTAGIGLGDMLVIGGAITPPRLSWVVGTGAAAGIATAVLGFRLWRGGRVPARADAVRAAACIGVPLAAAAVGGWIAAVQLAGPGLSYYFWKYAVAACVILAAVAVAAVVSLLPPARRSSGRAVAGVALTALALNAFGTVIGPDPDARGMVFRAGTVAAMASPPAVAADVLAAAATAAAPEARRVTLVEGTLGLHPIQASQWVNALSGRWTDESNELLRQVPASVGDPAVMAAIVPGLLADPATVVLVPAGSLEQVRAGVHPEHAARVLAW